MMKPAGPFPSFARPSLGRFGSALFGGLLAGLLSACGGGDSAQDSPAPVPARVGASSQVTLDFPVGLAVAPPATLPSAIRPDALVATVPGLSGARRLEVLLAGDKTASVLHGASQVTDLALGNFFAQPRTVSCFGRSVQFDSHDDAFGAASSSGIAAAGDLGAWADSNGGYPSDPCLQAAFNARAQGLSMRTQAALTILAAVRRAQERSVLAGLVRPPVRGETFDVTQPLKDSLPISLRNQVGMATFGLDTDALTVVYRVTLRELVAPSAGVLPRFVEVSLRHKAGADAAQQDGLLSIASVEPSVTSGAAMSTGNPCGALGESSQPLVVTTVNYRRRSADVHYGARAATFCSSPLAFASTNYLSGVKGGLPLADDGQIDPKFRIRDTRTDSKGWMVQFDRYGAHYSLDSGAGSYLYAWQTPGRSFSNVLGLQVEYQSAPDAYVARAAFGHGLDVAGEGGIRGLICNVSGPGAALTLQSASQYQESSLVSGAGGFSLSMSRIKYAPTNSCNSTRTRYDANADFFMVAGEGVGARNDLMLPMSSGMTVLDGLAVRGVVVPAYF